jgi:hypothetical protein
MVPSKGKDRHVGAIVGGVVGGIVLLIVLGSLIYFLRRRSRAQRPETAGAKHTEDNGSKPELDGRGVTRQSMPNADGNMVPTANQVHELDGAPETVSTLK